MTRLTGSDAAAVWLRHQSAAPGDLWTGVDATGWESSCWLLSAMYINETFPTGLTHEDGLTIELDAGAKTLLTNEHSNLDELTVAQGGSIGGEAPGHGWKRVRWADYATDLDEVAHKSVVPPCFRWFSDRSLPVNMLPPAEGSLDRDSLKALLATLTDATGGAEADVFAFYGDGPSGDWSGEQQHLWRGPVTAIPELADSYGFTPSNIWPEDRSWFVHTDYDLWATKVSGSRQLVHQLETNGALETIEWSPPPREI